MPILMTARYQIRPHAIDRCKKAIQALVDHVKENEKPQILKFKREKFRQPLISFKRPANSSRSPLRREGGLNSPISS